MEPETIQEIFNGLQRDFTPRATIEGQEYVVLPDGFQVHTFDAEKLLPNPRRKRGMVVTKDAASFVAYFNLFSDEHSMIFADPEKTSFVAIMDYHFSGEGPARWREHRAKYNCPVSEQWQTWLSNNGKTMSQVGFAQFLEDNLQDIADPPGAILLEVARTLEAKKSVNFSSSVRLDNGQAQFVYEEEIKGTAQRGTLEIPESFSLGIPVFYGGHPYRVRARLRWRIVEGKLQFWYNLHRPTVIVEDAFQAVYQQIADSTKAKIIKGSPTE